MYCTLRCVWKFSVTSTRSLSPVAPTTSMGHGGHVPPLLQMAGHGGTVSRRTANKKLTKLYWPSRKRSPKRPVVLLELKSGGARQKNCPHLRSGSVPPPILHFRIRSDATACHQNKVKESTSWATAQRWSPTLRPSVRHQPNLQDHGPLHRTVCLFTPQLTLEPHYTGWWPRWNRLALECGLAGNRNTPFICMRHKEKDELCNNKKIKNSSCRSISSLVQQSAIFWNQISTCTLCESERTTRWHPTVLVYQNI